VTAAVYGQRETVNTVDGGEPYTKRRVCAHPFRCGLLFPYYHQQQIAVMHLYSLSTLYLLREHLQSSLSFLPKLGTAKFV
jgi:hypothetical protein